MFRHVGIWIVCSGLAFSACASDEPQLPVPQPALPYITRPLTPTSRPTLRANEVVQIQGLLPAHYSTSALFHMTEPTILGMVEQAQQIEEGNWKFHQLVAVSTTQTAAIDFDKFTARNIGVRSALSFADISVQEDALNFEKYLRGLQGNILARRVLGYALLLIQYDPSETRRRRSKKELREGSAELRVLTVEPSVAQTAKISAELLQDAVNLVRSCGLPTLTMTIPAANTALAELLETAGFRRTADLSAVAPIGLPSGETARIFEGPAVRYELRLRGCAEALVHAGMRQ